jgi:hypothetical protein
MLLVHIHWAYRVVGFILMTIDCYYYFCTLLGDPGIPQDIWEKYNAGQINDHEGTQDEEGNARKAGFDWAGSSPEPVSEYFHKGDLGIQSAFSYNRAPGQMMTNQGRICKRCPFGDARVMQTNEVHCSLCGLCIEGYHHHCVFFTKCIGKGNLGSF